MLPKRPVLIFTALLVGLLLYSSPTTVEAASPSFTVFVTSNEVHGYEWPLGEVVTLLIDDPGIGGPVDYSDAQTVVVPDWDPGQTWVQFVVPETFKIQPGHIVTLMQGTTTKTHTVTNLAMTDVDPDTDIVTGTADPADAIDVWVCDDVSCAFRNEVADGSGDWTADVATPGDEPEEQDIFDIGPGTSVDAYEHDIDGNATAVQWRVPNPRFNVYVSWNGVHGYDWPLGEVVTLLIDDPGVPGPVDYSDAQTVAVADWDPGQTWVEFVVPETFDILPGHIVTLMHSTTTKIHTVTSLAVTSMDPDTDTVSGTAGPDSDVWVDTCCSSRHEVADGSGDWSADFSTFGDEDFEQDTFDIAPGTGGQANQVDADGDGTFVDWQVPNPHFNVWLTQNQVHGYEWPLGEEVTLLIDDPGIPGPVDYSDSQIAGPLPWDPQQIGVFFEFQGVFEVQPGHQVTLTDGITTKIHTVTDLAVTSVDPVADTVTGTADPGTDVDVDICDESGCASRHEVADGFGDWSADFSTPGDEDFEQDTYDIAPGTNGQARQPDDDGDGTFVPWQVPNPNFEALPVDEQVQGNEWPEGAEITLTIDDPATGTGVDYTDSQIVTSDGWGNTYVQFDFQGIFDVEPGHLVTLTDGTTTKEHTVTDLAITGVDPDTDMVTGTADPGADVWVDVCDESRCVGRNEVADGAGDWSADFANPGDEPGEEETYDLVLGSQGQARQFDDDGDATRIQWRVPNPQFNVWLTWNEVQGYDWPEGELVTLTIDDPGTGPGADYTDSQIAGPLPWDPQQIGVDFQFQGLFDVQPGHFVTLTDGVTTKTHTVTSLTVTAVDPDTDTVSGTTDPGTDVWVEIWEEYGGLSRHEVAGAGGGWTVDFSTPGDEDFEQDTYDIVPGSQGQARQPDDDGDGTFVNWQVPDPQFRVFPIDDRVEGWEWEEGVEVTLTIDDPGTGTGVDYTDSVIAGPAPWDPQQIIAFFHLYGIFDVQPGHLVTLTDGVTTKEHTVTNLAVTGMDPDFDTVSGSADPGSNVDVEICDKTGCFYRYEVADGAGDWSADFSIPGLEPGEEATYDLVPGSGGDSAQRDADRDATTIRWRVPDHRITVWPTNDGVDGYDWPDGVEVTLTIDDPDTGPGVDYTESGTADVWGNVGFYFYGTFDVQPGHEVTLTDGVTTKVHTVTNLAVTDVDPDTDTVSGTADPGTEVWVGMYKAPQRHEVADEFGNWTADFSTPADEDFEQDTYDIVPGTGGNARQPDDDGDTTIVNWYVPDPRFTVALSWNQVYGNDWLEGTVATLTIDDPVTPEPVDYTDSQLVTSDPWNTWVSFDLGESFELQPGQVITLTDGVTVKTHTVPNLVVTAVDLDTDTVSGTAEPGAEVDVYAWGNPSFAYRHEVADGGGLWTADFSTPGDEPGEDNIIDIVPGTNGQALHEQDPDGDFTYVDWYVPDPRFDVWTDDDRVDGNDFAVEALVTLTIDDPGAPGPVDYTDTQPVTSGPLGTWVAFDLLEVFDIQPGHIVTLTDGVITKEHTVTSVALTGADWDTDTVSGTADPGSDVDVYACAKGCEYRHEVADGLGDWTADFSIPGDEPGEEGTYDIGPFTSSYAVQSDADGDATFVWWADHDGDGIPDALDPDDDNDGFTDEVEASMGTDPLLACAVTGVHDGIDNDGDTEVDESGEGTNDEDPDPLPPDADDDQDIDVGDILNLFYGKIFTSEPGPPYQQRSDFDADGDIDVGDVLAGFYGRIFTSCV